MTVRRGASRLSRGRKSRGVVALGVVWLAGCTAAPPACNPYFPLPPGASWGYREVRQGSRAQLLRSVAVESVEAVGDVTTAVLRQSVSAADRPAQAAGRATTTVRCAAGAVQLTIEGAAMESEAGGQAAGTVRAQLPGLPAAERLLAGHSWESTGQIETTQGGTTARTSVARRSRVDGVFPVQVAAGDFPEALLVSSVETLELGGPAGGRQARQEIREWYVRGVGLVKRETRLAGPGTAVISTEDLVRYTGVAATQ